MIWETIPAGNSGDFSQHHALDPDGVGNCDRRGRRDRDGHGWRGFLVASNGQMSKSSAPIS